jgi:mono/diheme cytochrome c family protein
MLKKPVILNYAVLLLLFSAVILTSCEQYKSDKKQATEKDLVERGRFLVLAGGCGDCHTPKVFGPQGPQPDTTKLLSGHPSQMKLPEVDLSMIQPGKWVLFSQDLTAAVGLWGASFSANLTPDQETGIGTWQPEMFINAMRTGKHLGAGRPIMPPMPWENIGKLSDDDLRSIFAYLKTIKPIKNKVPDPIPVDKLASMK